jgi:uncharacterized protein YjbI with pentapeptide repeats
LKTIKPQKLGILTRCFEFKRKFYFASSVLMYVPLSNKPELYSEAGMWKFAAAELGKDAALDACIPKEKPEFLVAGSAFVPGGEKSIGCSVKVRLGKTEKELYVYGERFWNAGAPSEPVSFTSMKVDWEHAYGGEGFERNPLGKGFKPVKLKDMTVRLLPNVLYPNERIVSPEKQHEPASLGPVDFSWPQRFLKAGTHDDRWLKEDFPGFAPDIDWTIFNTAPPDQWLEHPMKADESFQIHNMHPEKSIITGSLPGFSARCFIMRITDAGESFDEIPQRLSTVWFFPHAERAILIYQGLCEVIDEDAADISHIVIGAERLNEQKPKEHYLNVMRKRLDKEKGPLYALRDSDLLPEGLETLNAEVAEDKAMFEGEGLIRKNLGKRAVMETEKARAIVAGYGLDPDLHGPKIPPPEEPLPDLEHLPEYMEKLFAEAEGQRKLAEEGKIKSLNETEELFNKMGLDFNVIREEIARKPKGPPDFSAQAQIDALKILADKLRSQGIKPVEIDAYLADETFCNRLYDGEKKLKEAYRINAHNQDTALAMPVEKALTVREAVQKTYTDKKYFPGIDLTGADLSGLDLKGADFEEAFLESVSFTGANLEGCNFKNAVMAHAALNDANLVNAVFGGANLGGALFINASAGGADFSEAILAHADLSGANFSGARLAGADLSGAKFENTDFSGVQAGLVTFFETDLTGLILKGAKLDKCNFLKVKLDGVDFNKASLVSAVFLEVTASMINFMSADMTNVRFVQQCSFDKADFSGAILNNANLRGTSLNGCNFTASQLNGADLSECGLNEARFYRTLAKDARFIKADLKGAVMISINAMNASFQRADLRGANLSGANLFQADFARVYADHETKLGEALTTKVRVYPRRKLNKEDD